MKLGILNTGQFPQGHRPANKIDWPVVSCACGCGAEFQQNKRRAIYIHGHNARGSKLLLGHEASAETKEKMSFSQRKRRGGAETRFWKFVEKTPGCWHWRGSLFWNGYGQFNWDEKKSGKAHRFSYELLVGTIPEGLDLDHLCRNRSCVNPAHLEPVTRSENLLRGYVARNKEVS